MFMPFVAVAAILIGGASVNKASITHVVVGTILVPWHTSGSSPGGERLYCRLVQYGRNQPQDHPKRGHLIRPDSSRR